MARARVASIVLTYENIVDTDECLRSLTKIEYPEHEIVLVDNGSRDGSIAELRRRWEGKVRIIETGANLGAAAGWNAGVRAVVGESADYLLVLNNDIVVEPSLVSDLLAVFAAAPDTALAAPVILGYNEPGRIWYAGGTYNGLLGVTRHPHMGEAWQSLATESPSGYVTGYAPLCAAMFSRDAFEKVGLFDEWFFFGHEDVDWCLRAKALGLRCRVVAKPLVRHKVSASSGIRGSLAFTPFSAYHFAAGRMKLGRKHNRGPRMLPYLIGQLAIRLPFYGLRTVREHQYGAIRAYFKGLVAGATAPRPETAGSSGPSEQ